jgi:hypothetical protein
MTARAQAGCRKRLAHDLFRPPEALHWRRIDKRTTAIQALREWYRSSSSRRTVLNTEGQLQTAEQLARVLVAFKNGAGIHLGEIARVVIGPAPAVGAASIDPQSWGE